MCLCFRKYQLLLQEQSKLSSAILRKNEVGGVLFVVCFCESVCMCVCIVSFWCAVKKFSADWLMHHWLKASLKVRAKIKDLFTVFCTYGCESCCRLGIQYTRYRDTIHVAMRVVEDWGLSIPETKIPTLAMRVEYWGFNIPATNLLSFHLIQIWHKLSIASENHVSDNV